VATATVTYAPRGAARGLFHHREPEVLLDGPAGTGKSRACLEKLHLAMMKYPNARGIILRKIRADLPESAIQTFDLHVISPFDNVNKVGGNNVSHYDYPNGSRVVIAGLDRDTKVMSTEYDMAYVQEATELDEEEWEALSTRMRNGRMPYQQIIADCNPSHPTHWLNQRANDGTVLRLSSRHTDNPVLYDDDGSVTVAGAAYIGRLDALTGARRDRLFLGKWVASEGMIYLDSFDRERNVIGNPWGGFPPKDWPRYWAVDFGYTNPFVCQWWAEDPDGRLYRYAEIYRSQRLVEDHAKDMLAVRDAEAAALGVEPRLWRPRAIVCDHDAEDRATLERHLNMPTVAARKEVHLGIQAVSERLRPSGDGKPRLFLIAGANLIVDHDLREARKPVCTEEEVEGYVWNDKVKKEEPVKEDDHGMDATRYVVMLKDWQAVAGKAMALAPDRKEQERGAERVMRELREKAGRPVERERKRLGGVRG